MNRRFCVPSIPWVDFCLFCEEIFEHASCDGFPVFFGGEFITETDFYFWIVYYIFEDPVYGTSHGTIARCPSDFLSSYETAITIVNIQIHIG